MILHTYRIDFRYTGDEVQGGDVTRQAPSKDQAIAKFMMEYNQWFVKEYGHPFEPAKLEIDAVEVIDKDIVLKEMFYLILELSTHGNTPQLKAQSTDIIAKYMSYFTQEGSE